jgi:aspartyl-tRNA(Asn)/glutamyl-tRNA(Gln) amidotransferase subunit B
MLSRRMKIGLEIHAQIKTETKLFSTSPVGFTHDANSQVNYFDLGIPGTLPKLNKGVFPPVIRTAYLLKGQVNKVSIFDRKHYFYYDLPLGFQITQFYHPIVTGGKIVLEDGKEIRLNRIHIETDAGKSIHDNNKSLLDYNRVGVPLMEIVTEPDFESKQQVEEFLSSLFLILKYADSCGCDMSKGQLRVDVNLSTYDKNGENTNRTEIKNLNSVKSILDAIDCEYERHQKILQENGVIQRATVRYDEDKRTTSIIRVKEEFQDYRYINDYNIPVVELDDAFIKDSIPNDLISPLEKKKIYSDICTHEVLSVLVNNPNIGKFFDKGFNICKASLKEEDFAKAGILLSNMLINSALKLSENDVGKINAEFLSQIVVLLLNKKVSSKNAKVLLEEMIINKIEPNLLMKERNLEQINDENILLPIVQNVLNNNKKEVDSYHNGSTKLLMFFCGKIQQETNGKANPEIAEKLVLKVLKEMLY